MFNKALPLKLAYFCLGVLFIHGVSAIAAGVCQPPASGCASAGRDGDLTVVATGSVVNTYYPGVSATGAVIMVGSPSGSPQGIASGDLLLVIQMQDGTPNAAGFYEYAKANSALPAGFGGTIILASPLVNTYNTNVANNQTFQVVRIPQNDNLTIAATGSLQSSPWNGSSGGIVALDIAETFTLDGLVDVSTQGFQGSTVNHSQGEGAQGPGVVSILGNINAGGGANAPNGAGGGGGANGGNGGRGGETANTGISAGDGGISFSADCGKIVLGGGGGISSGGPAQLARGTNGGGVILIRANTVAGSGSLFANGESTGVPDPMGGGGGGGAGGSIVIASNSALPAITIGANGGNGTTAEAGLGDGGGGSGGYIFVSAGSAITSVSPGLAGTSGSNAVNGDPGQVGTSSLSCAPGICAGANCPLCAITLIARTTPSCGCCHKGKIIVTDVSGGSGSYLFSLDGGTPQSSPVFRHLGPGVYQITVTDQSGCTATITVVVSRFR